LALYEELLEIAFQLQEKYNLLEGNVNENTALNNLEVASNEVGNSWSGSYIGYHSRIYYKDFAPPPADAYFSIEWGTIDPHFCEGGTIGEWQMFAEADVEKEIYKRAGQINLDNINSICLKVSQTFEDKKPDVLSILSTYLAENEDKYIISLKEQIENLNLLNENNILLAMTPRGQIVSRDSSAVLQGRKMPVHKKVLAKVLAIKMPFEMCRKLASLTEKAGAHIKRKKLSQFSNKMIGTNIFIGHGQSHEWRDLKDFIQDRLTLPWDEFNRKPVAGITNIQRLSQMLDSAALAFLVMTGEDEQQDGRLQARMNVIHEAGLFQGRLGFTKAIILLEEGCEEFSNIQGLGQIRFPKGNIKAAFEEIREVLEREDIIESN